MNYYKTSFIIALILISVAAISHQEQVVVGQPVTDTQKTLCDSNLSISLISGAIEQAQGADFFVECAANNLIVLLFPVYNPLYALQGQSVKPGDEILLFS